MNKKNAIESRPHDAFVKKSLSYPEIAHDFFKTYLPEEVLEKVDLSTLKQESSNFLSNELGEGLSDILYSVKFDQDKSCYLSIILEHQSTSDRWITFRIQKYMLRLCEEHLRKQKDRKNREKTLPVIYPVIFYTGKSKYTAPRSFYELFENAELAKKFFEEPVKVIDIHQIKDENLKNSYLDTMLYICKHIYAKNILKWILSKRINFEIVAKNNFQYMKDMLLYIMQTGETEDAEELVSVFQKIVPENKKGNVMSIAEKLRAEGIIKGKEVGIQIGIEKGREEGIKKVALNMLLKKLDEKIISESTGLSVEEINKLKHN